MNLNGKAALITGGARIGQTIAVALARRGVDVAMTYRSSRASAEETVKKAQAVGVRGLAVRADLTKAADLIGAVKKVASSFGRLDFLVNLASIYEKTALASLDAKVWGKNMAANLESAYLLSLQCAPWMKRRGQGRIVHFSDWVAASGRPRYKAYLPYYVSKAGVIGLTQALALELAPEILVNAIAPGPILPPPDLSAKENRAVKRATPLGRWGGPEEIAKAVLFLIETDFVTGECIRVDGGRHLL
ncbi:MAG TPA: SDR family oxidoreductase [Nitrospiria bacterium]|nr:SDR family oxidoreductase [Nitrospiria bacterium]